MTVSAGQSRLPGMRQFLSFFVAAMAVAGASCGGSPIEPRARGGSDGSDAPVPGILSQIRIGTSALVLRAPGETGQLTVEAFFTNGTSLDRTVEAEWTSQDPGVATVAPGGIVTAVGVGATRIDAVFDGKRSTVDVLITPPGTVAFTGLVREPGIGPMTGVLVREMGSNRKTTTDQNGEFRFAGLQKARFRVARDGYEVVELEVVAPQGRLFGSDIPRFAVDIPLQPIVRLDAGASLSQLTIAPDDVGYTPGPGRCWPCKLIRVTTGKAGTLRVNIAPQGIPNALHVWIDGRQFSSSGSNISATAAAGGSGEVLVYVGWSLSYYDEWSLAPPVSP